MVFLSVAAALNLLSEKIVRLFAFTDFFCFLQVVEGDSDGWTRVRRIRPSPNGEAGEEGSVFLPAAKPAGQGILNVVLLVFLGGHFGLPLCFQKRCI